jgi:5-methyltetrahydrofolate--homocysteine methyltransferase
MRPQRFWDLLQKRVILLDGGMGTELIRRGLPQGYCPELWNVEEPEQVEEIHRRYFEAGADVVTTNSFGGSPIKLAAHDLAGRAFELNRAAAENAVRARLESKFVAGSLGPTGKFLKPTGEYEENDFENGFGLQAEALAQGGVDFLLVETMYDLREALCALRGARSRSSLPVFVTMTFNRTPRGFFTLMGNSVRQCLLELEQNGVPIVGANCTLDSGEMADLVEEMRQEISLPILAQPNAGQPAASSDGKVTYSQDVDDYVRHIPQIIQNGANLIGGCCGTDPDYIRRMAAVIHSS